MGHGFSSSSGADRLAPRASVAVVGGQVAGSFTVSVSLSLSLS
jgi:hypothetical protein